MILVGSYDEVKRIRGLFGRFDANQHWIGFVSTEAIVNDHSNDHYLGSIDRLDDIVKSFGIEELIFCGSDLSNERIMHIMERLKKPGVEYRIIPDGTDFMVGSQNIRTADDHIVGDLGALSRNPAKRNKRLFDFTASVLILLLSPLLVWFTGPRLWGNATRVLFGNRSWVGFADAREKGLSPLGILDVRDGIPKEIEASAEMTHRLNLLYAQEYAIWKDLGVVLKGWRRLGRRSAG